MIEGLGLTFREEPDEDLENKYQVLLLQKDRLGERSKKLDEEIKLVMLKMEALKKGDIHERSRK